jgi:hypothetical protein
VLTAPKWAVLGGKSGPVYVLRQGHLAGRRRGRVWALDYTAGVLHALDPATGQTLGQVSVGQANRFATPAIYGSLVLVPALTGGLRPDVTKPRQEQGPLPDPQPSGASSWVSPSCVLPRRHQQ